MTSDNDPTSNSPSGRDRLFAEQDRAISDFDSGETTPRGSDDWPNGTFPNYVDRQRPL